MAAIKTLAQTKTQTYPEIAIKIIDSAFALSQCNGLTNLHWILSHINIEGNEQANKATKLTNMQNKH